MSFIENTDPNVDVFYEAWINDGTQVCTDDTAKIITTADVIRVSENDVKVIKRFGVNLRIERIHNGYPVLRQLGFDAYVKGVIIQGLLDDVKQGKIDVEHLVFRKGDNKPSRWKSEEVVRSIVSADFIEYDKTYTCPFNLAWMATVAQRVEDALADLPKYYEESGSDFFVKG